jgi:hypothetical protein
LHPVEALRKLATDVVYRVEIGNGGLKSERFRFQTLSELSNFC